MFDGDGHGEKGLVNSAEIETQTRTDGTKEDPKCLKGGLLQETKNSN